MKRLITLFALMVIFTIGVQAQIVGANEGPKASTKTTSSLYKPTGHYLKLEAGYAHIFSVAYEYQINPYVMIGAGAGIGHIYGRALLPVYAEATFSTPRYKWSFFGNIKIGAEFLNAYASHLHGQHVGQLYLDPRIGVAYKNFGLALGIGYGSLENVVYPDFSFFFNIPLQVK